MAKGRAYAESLVGPLDRSFYDTQRKVTQQANQTNWENLQNQYKNLTDQLKRRQEQANIDFAKGLVGVAEGSLDRMSNANQDMANRGLISSGLNNLVDQSDTAIKGEQILNLLGTAGDVAVNTAGQLASGNETYTNKAAGLAADLADTLGGINAGDIAAQMNYNQGLADIGESMEAREADNAIQAAQRALSRASSGSGTDEIDEEEEEFMRRLGINQILTSTTLSDQDKTNSLRLLYNVENAGNVVNAYNTNIGATDSYNKQFEKLEKAAKKANDKAPKKWVNTGIKKQTLEPKGYKDSPFYKGNKNTNTKDEYIWEKVNSRGKTAEQEELENFVKNGITYQELAELLYGR